MSYWYFCRRNLLRLRSALLGALTIPVTILAAVPAAIPAALAAPDAIFFGGPILTMDSGDRRVAALAVEDGRISALGGAAELRALADANTRQIDLGGHALLPGFVDSHSHAGTIGLQALSANLLPAPDGRGNSVAALQSLLRDYLSTDPQLLAGTGWLIGFGYDDSQLAEQRHPTRQELDAVSQQVPILIVHQSGHLGVANSVALRTLGVGPDTPDPEGGIFRREADGRQPNGVAEEYAFFRLIFGVMAGVSDALSDDMVIAGTQAMARYGYTTVQEGRATPATMAAIARVAARDELAVDLVAYPDMLMGEPSEPSRSYRNRFRVAGVKLTIDGSPQGKTAWLSTPYHIPPDGQSADYRGYPAIDAETVEKSVARAFAQGWQILVHANGDAAIDAFIDAVSSARATHPDAEIRPVLIHGQTLRRDQVARLDELRIFPSLFPMHTFYWGDWHRNSVLGPTRAEDISPTGWVRERGMMFGTHHDAPVALPDSMRVLSATVTRTTRSGYVLGPAQRVDTATALRAMTIWPAWQHFEEKEKGSLEQGKLADLVVLSADPLETDPGELVDLQVLATYKEGDLIYAAESADAASGE